MNNIDVFNNSLIIMYKKTPNKIVSWITIIIVLIIIFILIIVFYKFDNYYNYQGCFEYSNSYNFKMIVDKRYFSIKNKKYIYIKNKKYKYKIMSIEPIINENLKYWIVLVKLNNSKLKDKTISFKVKRDETTLLDYIKKGIDI